MANSASTPRDNVKYDVRFDMSKLKHPHGGSSVSYDYQQGDLMYWDSSAKYVKPLDSDANAAYLVGVALRSAYLAPYSSMVQSGGPAMVKNFYDACLVGFGAVFTFFSTAGETYTHGDSVYWGLIATYHQFINKTTGSHAIGTVYAPEGAITGGATVLVPVLVFPQIPVQSL